MFRVGSSNAGITLCCRAPGCKSYKRRGIWQIVNISLPLDWSATGEMIDSEDPEWYQTIFQGKTTYLMELMLAFNHFSADFTVWFHPVLFSFKSVVLFWNMVEHECDVRGKWPPCQYGLSACQLQWNKSGTKVPAQGFKRYKLEVSLCFFASGGSINRFLCK